MKKPVVLCIMDGFGHNPSDYGNAIKAANTPRLDEFMKNDPMTYIGASGMDVGLPDGQMGNSEVGHTNIGAGRVVYQELTRITKAITDGDFFKNPAFIGAVENCKKYGTALHLIGLYPTAAYTATILIFMLYWNSLNVTALRTFMFIVFLTVVTYLRHPALSI